MPPMEFAKVDVQGAVVLPARRAIVCHDAGAANLIAAWEGSQQQSVARCFVGGPATKIWAERLPHVRLCASLAEAMEGVDLVITGTGWASELEHDARKLAKVRGLPMVAVVDHWVNYAMRFDRRGEIVLPDEIWIADAYAHQEALRRFHSLPLRQLPNTYLQQIVDGVHRLAAPGEGDVLYALEPLRNDWGRGEPGEFQALDYFVTQFHRLGVDRGVRIRLRPHPSDPPGKYDAWMARQSGLRLELDTSPSLEASVAAARHVVGCESYVLVVAMATERVVHGSLPPWAPLCRLPHTGLRHLRLAEGEPA